MKSKLILATAITVSSFSLSSGAAHADEEIPRSRPAAIVAPEPAEKPAETEFYGWQIAMVDVTAVTVGVPLTIASADARPALVTGGLWLSGGPLIHAFQGEGKAALISAGLRLGLPTGGLLAGGMLGLAGGFSWGTVLAGAGGMTLGFVAASVVDVAVLAHRRIPPANAAHSVQWQPSVGLEPRGARVGIAGSF